VGDSKGLTYHVPSVVRIGNGYLKVFGGPLRARGGVGMHFHASINVFVSTEKGSPPRAGASVQPCEQRWEEGSKAGDAKKGAEAIFLCMPDVAVGTKKTRVVKRRRGARVQKGD